MDQIGHVKNYPGTQNSHQLKSKTIFVLGPVFVDIEANIVHNSQVSLGRLCYFKRKILKDGKKCQRSFLTKINYLF